MRSIIISSILHVLLIMITAMSLPFLAKPIDLPPIVSIELIQITDKTNIPFAPRQKTIEKIKEKEKKFPSKLLLKRLKKLSQMQFQCQMIR